MSMIQGRVGCICSGRCARKGSLRWRDPKQAKSGLTKSEGSFIYSIRVQIPKKYFTIVLVVTAIDWAGLTLIETTSDLGWLSGFMLDQSLSVLMDILNEFEKYTYLITFAPACHSLPTPILNLMRLTLRICWAQLVQKRPRARFRILDEEATRWEPDLDMRTWDDFWKEVCCNWRRRRWQLYMTRRSTWKRCHVHNCDNKSQFESERRRNPTFLWFSILICVKSLQETWKHVQAKSSEIFVLAALLGRSWFERWGRWGRYVVQAVSVDMSHY